MNTPAMPKHNLSAIKWLTFLMFMMFAMTTDSVGTIIPEVIKEFHLSMVESIPLRPDDCNCRNFSRVPRGQAWPQEDHYFGTRPVRPELLPFCGGGIPLRLSSWYRSS